jgi:hypothetical protein
MYDYICENTWIFDKVPGYAEICENKLIDVLTDHNRLSTKAEYYLNTLFNVYVEEGGEEDENNRDVINLNYYIITTKNEIIYV